jgi:hypothetical protein
MRMDSCHKKDVTVDNIAHLNEVKNAPVKHATSDAGNDHGIKEVGIGTKAEIDAVWGPEKDSLLKELNGRDKLLRVKEKELQAWYSIGTSKEGNVIPEVKKVYINHDSNYSFDWHNKFMAIDGIVGPTAKQLHYKWEDSLTTALYWKRKYLLGRKYTYMNAFSQDTNTKIRGLTGVQINDLGFDKFKLGGYIGYRTDFLMAGVDVGLSGEFNFTKRFSLEVNYEYLYDGSKMNKQLLFRSKYNFIKL